MPDQAVTLRLLRRSAHDLVREVDLVPAAGHLWKAAQDEWSVHECLAHLRDVERHVFLHRTQRIIVEDRPQLEFYDEVKFHQDHWNPDEPLGSILADFVNARAELVDLLSGADWSRVGIHPVRGPITLEWQADYALAHTWEHLSQMMRVRLNYELAEKK